MGAGFDLAGATRCLNMSSGSLAVALSLQRRVSRPACLLYGAAIDIIWALLRMQKRLGRMTDSTRCDRVAFQVANARIAFGEIEDRIDEARLSHAKGHVAERTAPRPVDLFR